MSSTDSRPAPPPYQVVLSSAQFVFALISFAITVGTIAVTFGSRMAVVEAQASQMPQLSQIVTAQSAQINTLIETQKQERAERLQFQTDVLNKLDRITLEIRRSP